MENSIKILKTIPYSKFDLWDVNRYVNDEILQSNYNLVPLSKLLYQISNYEKIQDEKEYLLCGLSAYGKGLFHRERKSGKEIKGTKLNQISQGQFIYSRLGANNGAFDIVSNQFNNYWVTNEFPIFHINEELFSEYLNIIFKLKLYWKIISRKLQGAAHKRFKEHLFLELKVPLPPFEKQKKIVENFNKRILLAERQDEKVKLLKQEINLYFFKILGIKKNNPKSKNKGLNLIKYSDLTKWALSHSLKENIFDIKNSLYNTKAIGELLLFFKGGKTPSKQRKDYWKGGINWTSPKDFNGLFINNSEDSITETAVKETKMEVFPTGTFLSVFRSGILRHSFPTSIITIPTTINQDLKAYALNEKLISKYYYLYFTEVFKEYILLKTSKKSVTVESINTEEFLELQIPLPPIEIQNKIANHISKLKQQIKELQEQAKENREMAIQEFENEIFN